MRRLNNVFRVPKAAISPPRRSSAAYSVRVDRQPVRHSPLDKKSAKVRALMSTHTHTCSAASCQPGHYYSTSAKTCTVCGYGFYAARAGAFECSACPVGQTTLTAESTSADDCKDECASGSHLIEVGVCRPCEHGTYRTQGVHKTCVPCPNGNTTSKEGATMVDMCDIRELTRTHTCTHTTTYVQHAVNRASSCSKNAANNVHVASSIRCRCRHNVNHVQSRRG
jgi:hypothetical protein